MRPRERILVHACCASCAAYVLEHLSERFDVTAFFYNPNIEPETEHGLRLDETRRVCRRLGIRLVEGEYDNGRWRELVAPHAGLPERSERCWVCYRMRLDRTAAEAARGGFGLFTSTLSVSPHKVFARIAEEGGRAARGRGVRFLAEDFKKRDGFRKSVERSRDLDLTRQDYCGCIHSRNEARERARERGKRIDG